MKLFIDTNIFLDIILRRGGEVNIDSIHRIISRILNRKYQGICSFLTIINILYLLRKHNISLEKINLFLSQCIEHFYIGDGDNQLVEDILLNKLHFADREDYAQYLIADRYQCDYIITNDKNGFINSDIPVFTPLEFVSLQ